VDRGHTVLSVSRSVAADRVPGATYVEGTLLDIPGLVTQLEARTSSSAPSRRAV
jgi:hypothetical protein